MSEYAVSMEHITKTFPGVKALDDVQLHLKSGRVMALLGENGAGKSTLMNIMYGINTPTAGSLYVRGEKVTTFSPKAAAQSVRILSCIHLVQP